nr:apolipoprotein N-acyltransferase [Kibdelosporangium sp. MJ126-NF4]CEL13690.1 Apolipoprotein N-acyltransferase in lipid-linked oligosaccharide synthesis cluster [Kibdelosporangium sp. MJ126-NF4]CTQ99376.1 Apolipoprotein N-acyltransferase (EC 2.3.1.-) in lipid-linked oligosaccharide synthesis cluster [Kibdelosporangium sp. MJ126-NF4]
MIAAPVSPEPESGERAGSFVRRHPVVWRTVASLVAGGLLYLSFPPRTTWWLAVVAFAVFAWVIRGRRARAGFGYGFLFAIAFLMPSLYWLQNFLGEGFGPAPWVGLSVVLSLYIAAASAGMAVVSTLPGGPVWMAALFVVGEAVRGRFPFGGFPWSRVGFGQPDGWLLPLASLGGAPLLTFAVVLTGCAIAELFFRRRVAPALMAIAPVAVAFATLPFVGTDAQNGTITVAVVQGNAPEGLGALGSGDEMRRNHIQRAEQLAQDLRPGPGNGGVPRPDVVIMPETFTGLGPNPANDTQLNQMVTDLGVPVLIGARQRMVDGSDQNVVIVWDPLTGPGQEYAKTKLVPFGEFVPIRPVARLFTPFVDGQSDMRPGVQPPVLTAAGTKLGVGICFEVAYDDVLTQAVRDGADVLTVPTNNNWYGPTEMSYQQLAMSRVRAMEHGRAVVVSATTGVSAIVQPDGSVTRQTELYTADTLVATVAKRSTVTLATRIGAWPEGVMVVGGLAALLWAIGSRIQQRQRQVGTDSGRTEED